jgi:hypothetical protein
MTASRSLQVGILMLWVTAMLMLAAGVTFLLLVSSHSVPGLPRFGLLCIRDSRPTIVMVQGLRRLCAKSDVLCTRPCVSSITS